MSPTPRPNQLSDPHWTLQRFAGTPAAEVLPTPHAPDPTMEKLDAGEEGAIALAAELHADLILMDDRDGVRIARSKGFRVAGTLGILAIASTHGLLNLAEAFDHLKRTTFHYQQAVMDRFLADPLRADQ